MTTTLTKPSRKADELQYTREAYLSSEERVLQVVMNNTHECMAYLDNDFDIVTASKAYAKNYGYAVDELIGKNHFGLFPSTERRAVFKRVRDTGLPAVFQEESWDGHHQDDWRIVPLKCRGRAVSGLLLIKKEGANNAGDQWRDEFMGLISHELRSPLTVIRGVINTVLSESERLSSEDTRHLLRDAEVEAESLSQLLWNLLELSRYQTDRLSLSVGPFIISRVVKNAVEKIRRQAFDYSFEVDLPADAPEVRADELRVERVLFNLLENAVKYSPKGSRVKVFGRLQKHCLIIGISDQGMGISREDQAKIFRPFKRLEGVGLHGIGGSGLGLLVCQRLVEAHKGRIWVESQEGNGSTFYFTLPLG